MNAATKIEASGLDLLRAPFPPHQISKLPKETKAQATQRKADQDKGVWPPKCSICDGYHHPKAVHLDYVGHAALTDRLLDCDPHWSWEPMGITPEGLPVVNGGLWIKLTVCGVSRYGFGAADGKSGGDAIKEMIGDALRNAAMRFGAALDLWHKGDLHADEEDPGPRADPVPTAPKVQTIGAADVASIQELAAEAKVEVTSICKQAGVASLAALTPDKANAVIKKLRLTLDQRKQVTVENVLDDEIPY